MLSVLATQERTVPFDCLPRQALRRAFDKLSTNGEGALAQLFLTSLA